MPQIYGASPQIWVEKDAWNRMGQTDWGYLAESQPGKKTPDRYLHLLALSLTVVGAAELWFAFQWRHDFGAGVGLVCLTAGLFLCAFVLVPALRLSLDFSKGSAWEQPLDLRPVVLPMARPLLQPLSSRQGSHAFESLRRNCSETCNLLHLLAGVLSTLCGFCFALLVIHLASPDSLITHFPADCFRNVACSRVARAGFHVPGSPLPLDLNTASEGVRRALVEWMAMESRRGPQEGAVLSDVPLADGSGQLVHLRFVSRTWGHAEDVVVKLSCVPLLSAGLQYNQAEDMAALGAGLRAEGRRALMAAAVEGGPSDDRRMLSEDEGWAAWSRAWSDGPQSPAQPPAPEAPEGTAAAAAAGPAGASLTALVAAADAAAGEAEQQSEKGEVMAGMQAADQLLPEVKVGGYRTRVEVQAWTRLRHWGQADMTRHVEELWAFLSNIHFDPPPGNGLLRPGGHGCIRA